MTVLGSGGKLLLIALVASGVAGTTGCATRSASTEVVIRRHPTAVRVRNYNWSDARVYLLPQSGGRPVRPSGEEPRLDRGVPWWKTLVS